MNKINQNWVFGQGAGLDFSTPIPTATSGFSITTGEGCASVSDLNGNLLFYTDGSTVWDDNHGIRVTGLSGNNSSTQSAIIVPKPGTNNEYYIFTADGFTGGNNHVGGVLLNISSWTTLNLSLPSTAGFSATEKITAIQHKNCKDFWVVTVLQQTTNNNALTGPGWFRVWRIDSGGVFHMGDTPIPNTNVNDVGYLKASPDGTRIAFANWQFANVYIFPFNNANGSITIGSPSIINAPNPLPLNMTDQNPNNGHARAIYGIEFSPNSQVLYYSILGNPSTATGDAGRGYVYQVDLGTNIQILVGTRDNTDSLLYAIGALQLGLNNIIYIAQSGEQNLGAILSPNTLGAGVLGCNLNWSQIALPSNTQCTLGLPNLLPNPCEAPCNCGCTGCNQDATQQNNALIQRASAKDKTEPSTNNDPNCPLVPFPVPANCTNQAIPSQTNIEPCFYFHWGDGTNDQIEEHDTEVFYLTVCNNFNDILFKGLRITMVTLNPNLPISSAHIVPDRFINIDCLEPCSCQTREFAIITRDTNIAGNYTIDVEYCYDEIIVSSGGGQGTASFPLTITED